MPYQLAPLFCRPWMLLGITPHLIESHYEGNYSSTMKRLNALSAELADARSRDPPARDDRAAEARRSRRAQLDPAARALFLQHGRRRPHRARAPVDRPDPRLRLGRPLAPGVHRARRRP